MGPRQRPPYESKGVSPMRWVLECVFVAAFTAGALFALAFQYPIWERPPIKSSSNVLLGPDTSNDPKRGSPLPKQLAAPVDALGRPVPEGIESLLVVNGGICTSCQVNAVCFAKLPLSEFDGVIVFYQSSVEDIRSEFRSELPGKLLIFADAKESVLRQLNALWTGRWYVFREGRLVRAQSYSPLDVNWSAG